MSRSLGTRSCPTNNVDKPSLLLDNRSGKGPKNVEFGNYSRLEIVIYGDDRHCHGKRK
jgi:hypothetical protein